MTAKNHLSRLKTIEVVGGRRSASDRAWLNRLLVGDSRDTLARLAGPLAGQVDLAYLDPPYFSGLDLFTQVPVGDGGERVEVLAYTDSSEPGLSGYRDMMREILLLVRRLLSPKGLVYLQSNGHATQVLRLLGNEIFGEENLRNEIVWCYSGGEHATLDFAAKHDTILRYSCSSRYEMLGKGEEMEDWWTFDYLSRKDRQERPLIYPTQKPLELVQLIIETSSRPGALVLDAFCGGGTTLVAAEGLRVLRGRRGGKRLVRIGKQRRWIGCDLSPWAIHVARTRLTQLEPMPSFDILGLEIADHEGRVDHGPHLDGRLERLGRRARVHLHGPLDRIVRWCVDFNYNGGPFHVDWESRRTYRCLELAPSSPWHQYRANSHCQMTVKIKSLDVHGRECEQRVE